MAWLRTKFVSVTNHCAGPMKNEDGTFFLKSKKKLDWSAADEQLRSAVGIGLTADSSLQLGLSNQWITTSRGARQENQETWYPRERGKSKLKWVRAMVQTHGGNIRTASDILVAEDRCRRGRPQVFFTRPLGCTLNARSMVPALTHGSGTMIRPTIRMARARRPMQTHGTWAPLGRPSCQLGKRQGRGQDQCTCCCLPEGQRLSDAACF